MKKKQIVITFTALGEVQIEGKGFAGTECEKFTKAFEDALGVVTDRQKKPEHSAHVENPNRQTA